MALLDCLVAACRAGDLPRVETLLTNHTSPSVLVNGRACEDGTSPLMLACANGWQDVARAMLAVPGVDLNHQQDEGQCDSHLQAV